ncbi:uncharacterized protein LOC144661922 isoform X2 [Oculina patagonica]
MNESKEETETHNKKTSEKEHCPFLCDNIMEVEEALEVRPWQGLRGNISMPIEEVSPLDVNKSSESLATVKSFHVSENDISEVTCDVGEMSDHSLAVTGSSDATISMPIEKVSPLEVHTLSEPLATEATCNVCVSEMSEVTCDIGEMNDYSLEQTLISNNIMEAEEAFAVRPWQGLRVKGLSLLDRQESTEVVDTEKASSISENEINGVTYDYGEISDMTLSVAGSPAINISMPIEMGSSLDVHKSRKRKRSCENCLDEDSIEPLIKRRRLLNIEGSSVPAYSDGEMGLKYPEGNSLEKHISSRHSLALKESCEANINMPSETDSSLDDEMSDHSLPVTGSPVSNISAPIEKDSSLYVQESFQGVATEDAGNLFENEISECSCLICDHWMAVTQSFPPYISMPVEKVASSNELESSDLEATVDTFQMSKNDISEVTCNNGEMGDHSLALTGSFATNVSMPIAKVSSLDVHDSSQAVATEEDGYIGENEINECSCVICKMSDHCLAVTRSFSRFISMPIGKVSSLDVLESTDAVATKDICNISENEISEVTCDNDGMSDHSLTLTGSPVANISMPIEKVSTLNIHKSSEAVGTEDTGYICKNEISEVTCDNGEMSDHLLAVTGSSATNISMPIEKASKLDVHELSEAVATEELEASGIGENEINECSCVICKMSDHCLAVTRSFSRYISMPVEKVSPQDVHESSEAVASKQAGNIGENGFSEYSEVSSLDVHEAAEARNARQRKRKRTSVKNVDESVRQSEDFIEPLRKSKRQFNVEEAAVPAFSKDGLCGNEAVEDGGHQSDSSQVFTFLKLPYDVPVNSQKGALPAGSKDELCGNKEVHDYSHQSDFSHVSASSKPPFDVHDNSEEAAAPAVFKDELRGNEAVKKDKHRPDSSHVSAFSRLPCNVPVNSEEATVPTVSNETMEKDNHESDSSHVSASSKLPCDVPVNFENASALCAKIKTEDVSVGALASDVDTPDTTGFVNYCLRSAYQLLFGAVCQDPVGSILLESRIHQCQEPGAAQSSQSTRARRRRMKRVWNGEAFVPEVQKRGRNTPYLRRLRPRRQ